MHIQTMHPKTHRATYILARGLMNAENVHRSWAEFGTQLPNFIIVCLADMLSI